MSNVGGVEQNGRGRTGDRVSDQWPVGGTQDAVVTATFIPQCEQVLNGRMFEVALATCDGAVRRCGK